MTIEECLKLKSSEVHFGQCTCKVGPRNGRYYSQEIWRINGRIKTWKTRPLDFKIPIKFGLYDYGYITPENCHLFHSSESCQIKEVRS